MSIISVSEVKLLLRVTHNDDDALLRVLVDAAEDEAIRYLGLSALPARDSECPDCVSEGTYVDPVSDGDVAPVVRTGISLMVQAMYEGMSGADMESVREVAFKLLRPYRCNFGVG